MSAAKKIPSWDDLLTDVAQTPSPTLDTQPPESRIAELRKDDKPQAVKPKAVKTAIRKVIRRKTGKRKTIRFETHDGTVTVSAKASEHLAVFWASEAKRTRLSMSYVILDALIEAYGLPEGTVLEEE